MSISLRKNTARTLSKATFPFREKVLKIAKEYGVTNVRIFGSFACGEQRQTSDIDLLVDLPGHMDLFELSGLKIDLEEAVHRKVDIVPSDSIKPALRKKILSTAQPL